MPYYYAVGKRVHHIITIDTPAHINKKRTANFFEKIGETFYFSKYFYILPSERQR